MKLRILAILCLFLAASCTVSCTKEARESAYARQEELIEKFIRTQGDARVSYNAGSTRVTVSEGEGVELNARGKAAIYYAGYDFTSGSISSAKLFATNSENVASSAKWNLSGDSLFEPVEVDLTDKDLLDGLRSGLEGVREGEECYILFSAKYAYGRSKAGTVPPNSPIAFHIWVDTIQN